jgi:hypothetical protein
MSEPSKVLERITVPIATDESILDDGHRGHMTKSDPTHPAEDRDTKAARLEHPSGLLYLLQHKNVHILIDALLGLPPRREFGKSELAEHAGVTRQTVGTYTDLLLEVDIIEEVPNTTPRRYRVASSDVVEELFALNSALNAAGNQDRQ